MGETEVMYREMLDEYGEVKIGSLTFYPSDIVQVMDPIAYEVGLGEFEFFLEEEND